MTKPTFGTKKKLNMAIHTCDKTINKSNSVFNFHLSYFSLFRIAHVGLMSYLIPTSNQKFQLLCKIFLAKTEHSHPLGMVVSTHFRCGKGVKRGLKNGALPFNID